MSGKPVNIALCLDFRDVHDQGIAVGAIKFAKSRPDCRLSGHDWKFHPLPSLDTWKGDGIIARIRTKAEADSLAAHHLPVVDIAGAFPDAGVASVLNDDRLTGVIAGRHLAACGFTHFAFVGLRGVGWSEQRLVGFREVAEGAGCEVIPHYVDLPWLERAAPHADFSRWLKILPRPCGLMAANDLIGYKTTLAAAKAGIAIPSQLAIIGVDNEEIFCELSHPSLTSIPCDREKIGWEAAALLTSILYGDARPVHGAIPPRPVVARASTDIVVGDDPLVREIRNFIRANIHKRINVADVVAAFPISRRSLEMRFGAASGRTIHEEIILVRLEKACRLLESGSTATQASHGSGFATTHHFHYVFRKHLHMTPLAYASRLNADKTFTAGDAALLPPHLT